MIRLLVPVFALVLLPFLWADDERTIVEVRAASCDDARIASMATASRVGLDGILSDSLHYAHSSGGFVEDKNQHISSLVERKLIYRRFEFKSRDFNLVAPGVVICKGRALVEVGNPRMIFLVDINFLGVWKTNDGSYLLGNLVRTQMQSRLHLPGKSEATTCRSRSVDLKWSTIYYELSPRRHWRGLFL